MIPGGDICIQKMKEIFLGKCLIMQNSKIRSSTPKTKLPGNRTMVRREGFYIMIDT